MSLSAWRDPPGLMEHAIRATTNVATCRFS
jgi:hypothetical protein